MTKIYIAGPFAEPRHREALLHMIDIVKKSPHSESDPIELYIPMEHKVDNDYQNSDGTWHLPNHEWARDVFWVNRRHIDEADLIVALYDGSKDSAGTAWVLGYAFGKNIPIIGYIPEYAKKEPMSLMIINSFLGLLQEDGRVASYDEFIESVEQK
jgi:nucleoside 2-deoxyribosyltransferase